LDTFVACSKCHKLNRVALERADASQPICGNCKADLSLHHGVQELNGGTLATLVGKSPRPVVVDFWAPWCGPCRAFAPAYEKAAQALAGKEVLAKLNTEADPQASARYQIQGIPTLIVFKNGVEVDRRSGALPLPQLMQFLNRWAS
jgi:thioredoxin 2